MLARHPHRCSPRSAEGLRADGSAVVHEVAAVPSAPGCTSMAAGRSTSPAAGADEGGAVHVAHEAVCSMVTGLVADRLVAGCEVSRRGTGSR